MPNLISCAHRTRRCIRSAGDTNDFLQHHGVSLATDFAQLWLDVGLAIGTESRALYNEGSGHVWLFAPNINLLRDPRWGRAQEVPGEDATLVAAYAAAFVRGVQASCPERRHPSRAAAVF